MSRLYRDLIEYSLNRTNLFKIALHRIGANRIRVGAWKYDYIILSNI